MVDDEARHIAAACAALDDPITCVHIGRSTWQGPASAAPRKEDRMTHDPEAAQRLARCLDALAVELEHEGHAVSAMFCGNGAALIRAQATEIERLEERHARQLEAAGRLAFDEIKEARNAAFREAASELEVNWGHIVTPECRNGILALIDTPAPPPAEPAGDALRTALERAACDLWVIQTLNSHGSSDQSYIAMLRNNAQAAEERARAALAAAPAPIRTHDEMVAQVQHGEGFATAGAEARWIADMESGVYDEDMPAPQPDTHYPEIPDTPEQRAYIKGWNEGITAGRSFTVISDPAQPDEDEREAMSGIILDAIGSWIMTEQESYDIADALLAAGWTRKRDGLTRAEVGDMLDANRWRAEVGRLQLEIAYAEKRGAERMRERAALWMEGELRDIPVAAYASSIRALPQTEETPDAE